MAATAAAAERAIAAADAALYKTAPVDQLIRVQDENGLQTTRLALYLADARLAAEVSGMQLKKMTRGRKPGSDGPLVTALVQIIREEGDMPAKELRRVLLARFEEGSDVWCFEAADDEQSLDIDHVGKGVIKLTSFQDSVTRARKRVKQSR